MKTYFLNSDYLYQSSYKNQNYPIKSEIQYSENSNILIIIHYYYYYYILLKYINILIMLYMYITNYIYKKKLV